MVLTPSTMLPLGTPAADFSLLEPLTGKSVSLADVKLENGVLIAFLSNHCPFVILLQDQLQALGRDLKEKGVGMVGISSNDIVAYPSDNPERMAELASTKFTTFPYLFDATQEIAKSYRAACTPDIYLFDKDLKLVYRGRVDDARPGNGKKVTGRSIRAAVDLMVTGKPIPAESMLPSMGCNIKWARGNAPDYFG
ncbi:hypothetical protein BWQ96_05828 [Gracilariopsis chorda]|uniref:Thioredoxin domain-containing protein n=1 Tax=Gracilariopsis chorda TaxID=448386 RepID=A0A2V3IQJ8_9FLOR|nr:hypothetical protein BWQ96_05828 [Gracilariopsis chorda]|eukprot:PXF44385.1 hypothetical protein BWQ96_05828 [Gracilariopsis chorda]